MDLQQSGTSGNPITITKGADTGHAGTVLLQGPGSGRGISMITASHITISGLSLKGWKTAIYISGSSGSAYSESSAAKQIIIENNDITFDAGRGVFIQTSDHITVRNNYMETPDNVDAQTDGIYSQRNHLNTYEGNTIIINNQDTGGHDDCIQLYDDTDITIRGNYVEQHNDKSGNAQGIYATTMYGTSYYYNNVVNLRNAQSNGLTFRKLTGTGTVVMIGNTVYSIRAYHTAQITETADPVVKNNIFFHDVASPSFDLTGWSGDPSNIDGNLYFTAGGSGKAGSLNGSSKSFSAWQALGFDANGMYADPKVVSIPNKDFRLQSTSPAVDAGRALGTPYAFDKDGVPRAQGSGWDIGAYEQ